MSKSASRNKVKPDTILKTFWRDNDHFADLFNAALFDGEQVLNPADLMEVDTDVLYQWRELVPTYEERITRIDGIYLKNVICESADAIYELKGDAKLPVRNVVIKDVHVDKVNDFVKKVHNVKNVKEDNVTYGSLRE